MLILEDVVDGIWRGRPPNHEQKKRIYVRLQGKLLDYANNITNKEMSKHKTRKEKISSKITTEISCIRKPNINNFNHFHYCYMLIVKISYLFKGVIVC